MSKTYYLLFIPLLSICLAHDSGHSEKISEEHRRLHSIESKMQTDAYSLSEEHEDLEFMLSLIDEEKVLSNNRELLLSNDQRYTLTLLSMGLGHYEELLNSGAVDLWVEKHSQNDTEGVPSVDPVGYLDQSEIIEELFVWLYKKGYIDFDSLGKLDLKSKNTVDQKPTINRDDSATKPLPEIEESKDHEKQKNQGEQNTSSESDKPASFPLWLLGIVGLIVILVFLLLKGRSK